MTRLENNRRKAATKIPYTDYDVIRAEIENGVRVAEIAGRYGVTTARIYQIKATT